MLMPKVVAEIVKFDNKEVISRFSEFGSKDGFVLTVFDLNFSIISTTYINNTIHSHNYYRRKYMKAVSEQFSDYNKFASSLSLCPCS